MEKQAKKKAPKKPKVNFEEADIHIIREEKSQSRHIQLRTVRWIVDGNDTGMKLEKRSFFVKDEVIKSGKMVGFKKSDLEYIMSNWDEISVMMG